MLQVLFLILFLVIGFILLDSYLEPNGHSVPILSDLWRNMKPKTGGQKEIDAKDSKTLTNDLPKTMSIEDFTTPTEQTYVIHTP